jgi:hypothetical protein
MSLKPNSLFYLVPMVGDGGHAGRPEEGRGREHRASIKQVTVLTRAGVTSNDDAIFE